jgi:hypothetical protein
MKTCAMPVVSLRVIHNYPDNFDENHPDFKILKKIIELEFYIHFQRNIDITNWEYILRRPSAYL